MGALRTLFRAVLTASLVSFVAVPGAGRTTPKTHIGTTKPSKGSRSRPKKRDKPPEFPADAADSPACAAALLEPSACLRLLTEHGVHFRKADPAPGIQTPIRLEGPLNGVVYRTDYPDAQRPTSPFEVMDCRLAVALSGLSSILKEHGIEEVRMFSAWRPPAHGEKVTSPMTAHPGGLAADLRLFEKSGGAELEVLKAFHGRIGAPPCGASAAPLPKDGNERELRAMYCAIADARLFHVLLSPNFDDRHANHFHVEVRPGVRWFIVR